MALTCVNKDVSVVQIRVKCLDQYYARFTVCLLGKYQRRRE